ncbi:MAG: hypothetical protein VB858_03360, partial [Planctomycetaceae bacterium]
DSWAIWTSRPYAGGSYGFGWSLSGPRDNPRPVRLTHGGSLASSRSMLRVELNTGEYSVVHYTVAARNDGSGAKIRQAIESRSDSTGRP